MPDVKPLVGAAARPTLDAARRLLADGEWLARTLADARGEVTDRHRHLAEPRVRERLAQIPVERLRDSTRERLRLAGLPEAGFRTVLDVLDASAADLDRVEGVGEVSAAALRAAAEQVASAVTASVQVRVDRAPVATDPVATDPAATGLVVAVRRLADLLAVARPLRQLVDKVVPALAVDVPATEPLAGHLRWWFGDRARKDAAVRSWGRLAQTVAWAEENRVLDRVARVREVAEAPAREDEAWEGFRRDPAGFYSLLASTAGLRLEVAAVEGHLPAEIVAAVEATTLDDTHTRMALRGYQSFGARFALVQRRVILGDEMGLGKTVQAIAALAHLRADGATHFLVVCPASVVVNWVREVRTHSDLTPVRLHGDDRGAALATWREHGGVGVTTFETLAALALDGVRPALLVVDEAHYCKNPATRRAQLVHALGLRADRVLFLTGTPMENRVDEFRSLVEVLHPAAPVEVDALDGVAGPEAFRTAVAPVYLRRNAEDVLTELPQLIQVDEWEEFVGEDATMYADAVRAGNFSAMRRAGYASDDPRESAKLARLLELCNEARKNGRKVVVFSYFLGVLATVDRALTAHGFAAFGPLTGATPPADRQRLVDDFSAAPDHAVLVSQIQAGGVGLNMQAASVVILCEPQVKPTMETQAIARAHRMGQLRTVMVHRLLTEGSVDERLLEILGHKERLFDAYARESELADASPSAVDLSEASLARQVVAAERARLTASVATRPQG